MALDSLLPHCRVVSPKFRSPAPQDPDMEHLLAYVHAGAAHTEWCWPRGKLRSVAGIMPPTSARSTDSPTNSHIRSLGESHYHRCSWPPAQFGAPMANTTARPESSAVKGGRPITWMQTAAKLIATAVTWSYPRRRLGQCQGTRELTAGSIVQLEGAAVYYARIRPGLPLPPAAQSSVWSLASVSPTPASAAPSASASASPSASAAEMEALAAEAGGRAPRASNLSRSLPRNRLGREAARIGSTCVDEDVLASCWLTITCICCATLSPGHGPNSWARAQFVFMSAALARTTAFASAAPPAIRAVCLASVLAYRRCGLHVRHARSITSAPGGRRHALLAFGFSLAHVRLANAFGLGPCVVLALCFRLCLARHLNVGECSATCFACFLACASCHRLVYRLGTRWRRRPPRAQRFGAEGHSLPGRLPVEAAMRRAAAASSPLRRCRARARPRRRATR